jgi:YebC/PmpR family DNA-binding regulatory protein
MSGHSKWANIKHRKGRQDAKRGKIFTRLGKEITISAREGGGDIDSNARLRLAIQNAKAANMPGENIKRAIQRGTGEIEGVNYEEVRYEGFGPHGISVIMDAVTDNKNRTVAELRSQFSKLGGNLGETNSVAWNFSRKGVVTLKTNNISEDEYLEHVLESGADDLEYEDEQTRVICAMENYAVVNKYFSENKKFEIEESKLEYIPNDYVKIDNVSDAKKVMKFIENFEEHDDIQSVFSNFDIDDSILEQIED